MRPMPFMAEQQKALIARGVPAENIHSEALAQVVFTTNPCHRHKIEGLVRLC